MAEARRDADLAQEALRSECRGEFRVKHLDGDVAIMAKVVRQIYDRHATSPELAIDPIPFTQGLGDARFEGVHGAILSVRAPLGEVPVLNRTRAESVRLAPDKLQVAHHVRAGWRRE